MRPGSSKSSIFSEFNSEWRCAGSNSLPTRLGATRLIGEFNSPRVQLGRAFSIFHCATKCPFPVLPCRCKCFFSVFHCATKCTFPVLPCQCKCPVFIFHCAIKCPFSRSELNSFSFWLGATMLCEEFSSVRIQLGNTTIRVKLTFDLARCDQRSSSRKCYDQN